MLKHLILVFSFALCLLASPAPLAAADPCPGARPIAEVRKLPVNSPATVRGIVTVPTGALAAGKSFAVQDAGSIDAASGIYVYRSKGIGQELATGDDVCVTGKLAEYHGLLELLPASPAQVVRLGAGKPPQPQVIEPGKIGEATEGRLVSVTGPVSRLGDRRFRVGDAAIFLEKQTGITTAGLTEGCPVTVIGLSAAYDSPQIWPRSQADVIPGDCTPAACEPLTISQIQGSGDVSPYHGKTGLACLTGCVTGVTADGFTLQSPEPDVDPRTSEGIYAYRYSSWTNPRGLRPGDLVELRNFGVQEYYDQTEIVGLEADTDAVYRVSGRCELPAAVPVPPLTDPDADPVSVYESFEGMRVALSFDGAVTGPTARYVSRYPAGDPEIALVDRGSPLHGQRIFAQEGTTAAVNSLPVGRGMVYLTGGTGVDLPDVGTGDRVSATNLTGVLAYQFGRYVLMVEDPAAIRVEDAPDVVDVEAEVGPDQFAVCTMNLENLFDTIDDGDGDLGDWAPADPAEFEAKLQDLAAVIHEDLRGCTIIGLQEVEGKDDVWEALARAVGPDFRYDYFESADVRDITVGVLYDARRATLRHSEQAQTCTPTDYRVDYTAARGPRARPNPCSDGAYPLFDRPPYLADLTVQSATGNRALDLRIVVNHLKSKRGEEAINAPRRAEQARFVAGLLTEPNSVALGDFNDPLGTPTLAQFAGYVNLHEAHLPPRDRYTYIFNGLSEPLDHFVMTPELDRYYLGGGPVHVNADFPEKRAPDAGKRSSDHDPLFVRFSFQPTGVSAALVGAVTGAVVSVPK
jgi:predicted extracellular nuclease